MAALRLDLLCQSHEVTGLWVQAAVLCKAGCAGLGAWSRLHGDGPCHAGVCGKIKRVLSGRVSRAEFERMLMTPGLRKDAFCHEWHLTILTTCRSPNQTQKQRTVRLVIDCWSPCWSSYRQTHIDKHWHLWAKRQAEKAGVENEEHL